MTRALLMHSGQGLRDLGWVEGKTIVIDIDGLKEVPDRLPDLAVELVRLKVDVILALALLAVAVAAKNATTTIPIVMANRRRSVGLGLVASLARPGGNVTGLSFSVGTDIQGKWLELLKETVPEKFAGWRSSRTRRIRARRPPSKT